jgi:hypothetical protein
MESEGVNVKMRKIKEMLEDESALATFGNLCVPMLWMTLGAVLETIGGSWFGCIGKLWLFCCPA